MIGLLLDVSVSMQEAQEIDISVDTKKITRISAIIG
jgi:hypothetical protein